MTESLPPDLQQFVRLSVAGGRYGSEAELMVEAVRALRNQDVDWERFRSDFQARIEQLDQGDAIDIDRDQFGKFFDELIAETDREIVNESSRPR